MRRDGAELEQLKAAGNERFGRRDYRGALRYYDDALGGPDARGDGLQMGLLLPLLNNRAACHLEIADEMSGYGEERVEAYQRAEYDAQDAVRTAQLLGGNAKALFRLGRSKLGVQALRAQLIDDAQHGGRATAAEALQMRKRIAKELEVSSMHLHSALELQPGDRMIGGKLEEAERLQAALARRGAPPMAQAAIPVARPETFGPSVEFTQGASWMSNRVALLLPVPNRQGTGEAMLPMYLSKQQNDNNRGELAIWMHYSAHLGQAELDARGEAAFGEDAQYEVAADQPYGAFSTPAQANEHIQSPDEFVMAFDFARHDRSLDEGIPGALVASGVIERVRTAGHTGFGEAFVVYRVKF